MFKKLLLGSLAASLFILFGCTTAPQAPIAFDPEKLNKNAKIGVLINNIPKSTTHFPGADCLLCMATASAMNSSLTQQVESLPVEDLKNFDNDLISQLSSAGYNVSMAGKNIDLTKFPKTKKSKDSNLAPYDFSKYKGVNGIDHLLVIEFSIVGVHRNFASYVPTSPPYAVVKGSSYLVNLATNTYVWYSPIDYSYTAEGEWDEPPKFPGVTNAFYLTIEKARDQLIQSFLAKPIQTTAISQ